MSLHEMTRCDFASCSALLFFFACVFLVDENKRLRKKLDE